MHECKTSNSAMSFLASLYTFKYLDTIFTFCLFVN